VVVYVVSPILGEDCSLLLCELFSKLLAAVTTRVRSQIVLQGISMEHLLGHPLSTPTPVANLKDLAFAVYTKCRPVLVLLSLRFIPILSLRCSKDWMGITETRPYVCSSTDTAGKEGGVRSLCSPIHLGAVGPKGAVLDPGTTRNVWMGTPPAR